MASKTTQILQAVKSALSAIDGAGSYTNDLSGTGQVVIGRPRPESSVSPCVSVDVGKLDGTFGTALLNSKRDLVVEIEGRVDPDEQTTESRTIAAVELLNDLFIALESDTALAGLVWVITASGTTLDGDSVGLGQQGIAYIELTASWEQTRGTGI